MRARTTPQKTKHAVATETAAPKELMDMAQAIEALKTTRPTFYRWLRGGKLKGMKVGRQWRFYRKDIEAFLTGAGPRIDLSADIEPLLAELVRHLRLTGKEVPVRAPSDEPLAHAVRLMVVLAVRQRASDIHVAIHTRDAASRPEGVFRLRVDGCLHVVSVFDQRLATPLVEQFKRMAACDLNIRKLPQDGRILMELEGATFDLRANFLPSVLGEAATLRILGRESLTLKLADLPYAAYDRERIQTALAAPNGVVLCTGPVGSGKTTSLYACLQAVATADRKVVTIEDPVEYMLPWANQIPVHADLPIAHAIRAALRSDPDVLLIGEIRDRETLQMAFQCALTGHMVLSSLHTDDATASLLRELDLGVNPFLVADCPQLVVAQRLVRKLCDACAVPCKLTSDELEDAAEFLPPGASNPLAKPARFRKPVGCPRCANVGFRGRTLVAETLRMTPELGRALRQGATHAALRDLAIAQGMVPMQAHGVACVARGETTLSELRRLFTGKG